MYLTLFGAQLLLTCMLCHHDSFHQCPLCFCPSPLSFSYKLLLFLPALDAPSSSVCSAVLSQDRLLCASLSISQGDCEARGCCYDPRDRVMPCYFGNTVTAHCTADGHFSIAVSRDVTLPPVILDSVHLASGHGTGCVPVVKNNAFVVYHFPLPACGTASQVTGDQVIYENELVASRDVKTGRLGSVTRDSTFR
ncbi:zona pellucida sperm-binding protein 4-like [Amazona ochrocephala]